MLTCAALLLASPPAGSQTVEPHRLLEDSVQARGLLEDGEPEVGQEPAQEPDRLDELVALARERNPEIQAARRAAGAAEAWIPQAGALPDPSLFAGQMWVPVPSLDISAEGMTMATVQLSQRIPVPGSRGLRQAEAEALHGASAREVEETEVRVIARLKAAYHELVFAQEAERVLRRNWALLEDLATVAQGRLAVGRVPQQDVLRAQTEVTRIDAQLAGLEDRRTAALSEINAVLDRDPLEPLTPEYPQAVRQVAMARPPAGAFTAASLEGGLGADLPSLQELQAEALRSRPGLLAQARRVEAMDRRREVAVRERWPDLSFQLGYHGRSARLDMVSLGFSVDLPVFRGRKQDQAVVQAEQVLAEEELLYHRMLAELRSEVARRYNSVVRTRERILLLAEGVIPQARATVESATGAYQAGRVEFAGLLEAQATLFRNEIELTRLLADFGSELAALEAAVGTEIEPRASGNGASDSDNDGGQNR